MSFGAVARSWFPEAVDRPVTLAATPGPDPASLTRSEYKYVVPPSLVDPIRASLHPYCVLDPFAEREPGGFYLINTLYLDTPDLRLYWDKENEVPDRFKQRIRTYGADADGPVKFEIKRRFNDVYLKTSVFVPRERWPELLENPAAAREPVCRTTEKEILHGFVSMQQILGLEPKMVIRYERQAFRSRLDSYVRVSFDRNIEHHPSREWDLSGRGSHWWPNNPPDPERRSGAGMVLELKFANRPPLWLEEIVRRFGLVRGGFSKYCTAVSRTLLAGRVIDDSTSDIPVRGPGRSLSRWQSF
jgi:hypothetical protein